LLAKSHPSCKVLNGTEGAGLAWCPMNPVDHKSTPEASLGIHRRLARIPPPPAFAFPLVIGLLLGRWIALPIVSPSALGIARAVGIALLALGFALAVACVALFARRRTTIVPHRRASSLVTVGPYRLTRNPMYVSLTLLYLGVAVLGNVLWPLLLLVGPLLLVALVHIPMEEGILGEAFGEEYRLYTSRVRRWL
jgi:protein-S-isoprenylcysteine O-methyltransferase Ste14